MPKFVAVNKSNQFDPMNNQEFATQEEADVAARNILAVQPLAQVSVMQVLKEYSAKVSVTAKDPATPEPAPTGDSAGA